MDEMDGVLKLEEEVERLVESNVPPTAASYHLNVPLINAVAESDTDPVPHVDPSTPVGAVGTVLTTAFTAVRVALIHKPLSNST